MASKEKSEDDPREEPLEDSLNDPRFDPLDAPLFDLSEQARKRISLGLGASIWVIILLMVLGSIYLAKRPTVTPAPRTWVESEETWPDEIQRMVSDAEASATAGDPNTARIHLLNALQKQPDSADLHQRLATIHVRLNEPFQAIRLLETATGLDHRPGAIERDLARLYLHYRHPRIAYDMGLKLLEQAPFSGDPDILTVTGRAAATMLLETQAAELANKASTLSSNHLARLQELGELYLDLRRFEPAERMFSRALELQATNLTTWVGLAASYRGLESWAAGAAMLERAQAANPHHPGVRVETANWHLSRGAFQPAEEAFASAVKHPAAQAKHLWGYGRLLQQTGRYDKAQELGVSMMLMPEAAAIRYGLQLVARQNMRQGFPQKAADLCRMYIQEHGPDHMVRTLLAKACFDQGLYKQAMKETAAMQREGELPVEQVILHGRCLFKTGQPSAAIDWYREAEGTAEARTAFRRDLAHQLLTAGDFTQARVEYEALLADHPEDAIAANNLAHLMMDTGASSDDALALIEPHVKRYPGNAVLADTKGWILVQRGAYEEAIHLLDFARHAVPTSPTVAYHLGVAYFKYGDPDLARQYLGAALRHPTPFSGREEAARILHELGVASAP